MGGETENVRIRASGAPIRCPFCHADVDRESEEWVACEACLARHHAACWTEGRGCAGCGETRFVARAPALDARPVASEATPPEAGASEGLPRHEVSIVGRRAHFEGLEALELYVSDGVAVEPFLLRVTNESTEPQRVEVRRLPGWLRAEGPAALAVAPGATATFRLAVDPSAVTFERVQSSRGSVIRGLGGGIAHGAFVVATDDDSMPVTVNLTRETPRSQRLALSALFAVIAHVGVIFCLVLLVNGGMPRRKTGESDNDYLFRKRQAEANGRLGRSIGTGLLVTLTLATVIAVLVAATR